MYVEKLMTTEVKTCSPDDTLDRAAQLMWESDCGFVPVVDSEQRVVGAITDRDICMAAYTQGVPLAAASVKSAMTSDVYCAAPRATVAHVEELMHERRIRRVPVVDAMGRLVGLITLTDLLRSAQATSPLRRPFRGARIARILARVCAPRANGGPSAQP